MAGTRIDHWAKLGATVREARLARGWSQSELATRAEVSRSWLARVESGHRRAELEPLLRLIATVGLTVQLSPTDDAPEPSVSFRRPAAQARLAAWTAAGAADTEVATS